MNKHTRRLCLNCDRVFYGKNTLCDSCIDDFELEDVDEKFVGGNRP